MSLDRLAGRLVALSLLAMTLPTGAHAQGGAPEPEEAIPVPSVHAVGFARVGNAFAFAYGVVSVGAGVTTPLSGNLGLRGDAEVVTSFPAGGTETALVTAPAAVLYLGDEASADASLRAGPLISLGDAESVTGPNVVNPFLGISVPFGSGPIRFEALTALLSDQGVLVEVGLGAAVP